MMRRTFFCSILLLALCVALQATTAASERSVVVSQDDGSLLEALGDASTTTIILASDVSITQSQVAALPLVPVPVNRNVTIMGRPGATSPLLDLGRLRGVVQLCAACTLRFVNVSTSNQSSRGRTNLVSLFMGQPGSRLVLQGGAAALLVCPPTSAAVAHLRTTPRSPAFPAPAPTQAQQPQQQQPQQRVDVLDASRELLLGATSYRASFTSVDVSYDQPLSLVEGNVMAGGYALWLLNRTVACAHYVTHDCLLAKSQEECIADLADELQAGPAAAAAPAAAGANVAAIAAPIAAAAALLLAAGLALLLLLRRRRRSAHLSPLAAAGHKGCPQPPTAAAAAASSGTASPRSRRDSGANGGSDIAAGAAGGGVHSVHHSGAHASCSSRDGGDLEMQIIVDGTPAADIVRKPLALGTRGWEVVGSQTTPSMQAAHNSTIQLGELLGAGSFARVFRGRWAGRDVAVKVIEHDSSTTAVVENEVQLMMSLEHENVVAAFHYVSYMQVPRGLPPASTAAAFSHGGAGSRPLRWASKAPPQPASSAGGCGSEARTAAAYSCSSAGLNSWSDAAAGGADQSLSGEQAPKAPLSPRAHMASASASASLCTQQQPLSPRTQQQAQLQAQQQAQQQVVPLLRLPSGVPASAAGSSDADGGMCRTDSDEPPVVDINTGQAWSIISGSSQLAARTAAALAQPVCRCETWLVLELADVGTLSSLAARAWTPEQEGDAQMLARLLLLADCARGVMALHERCIVHGDLNSNNVLVSSDATSECLLRAKLSDLGLSRVVKQATHRTTRTVGTLSHMAPCLLAHGRLSPALDIYSFGIMMWELFTGKIAFQDLHYGQFFETVVLRAARPEVPDSMPDDYQLLMRACWQPEPSARPTAGQVLACLELMIQERRRLLAKAGAGAGEGTQAAPAATPPAGAAAAAPAADGSELVGDLEPSPRGAGSSIMHGRRW